MELIAVDMASGADITVKTLLINGEIFPCCSDFEEDCDGVKNKAACWMHQPENGLCPYLTNT